MAQLKSDGEFNAIERECCKSSKNHSELILWKVFLKWGPVTFRIIAKILPANPICSPRPEQKKILQHKKCSVCSIKTNWMNRCHGHKYPMKYVVTLSNIRQVFVCVFVLVFYAPEVWAMTKLVFGWSLWFHAPW